jgi:hypothetical protein
VSLDEVSHFTLAVTNVTFLIDLKSAAGVRPELAMLHRSLDD